MRPPFFFKPLHERVLPSLHGKSLSLFQADINLAHPLASEIDTGETSKIRFS
jgi:hypothetical protein